MTNSLTPKGTVVFLHPVALDADSARWLDVPGLRAVTLPVRPDGADEAARPSLEDMADTVASGLSGPSHLVGCSMGGMVAMHLALRHPELVASLVLAFTTGRVPHSVMIDRAEETERRGVAMADETLARWFTPQTLALEPPPEPVRYVVKRLHETDPTRIADSWRAIAEHDVLDRLADVEAPATCVAGTHDASTPLSAVTDLARALPRSRVVELPTAHMGFLEDPAAFSTTVRSHLEWAASDGGAR